MNQDTIKGQWKQVQGKLKQQWADFTDDDIKYAEGSRDYLVGKVQERCGRTREQAEREVHDFEQTLSPNASSRS